MHPLHVAEVSRRSVVALLVAVALLLAAPLFAAAGQVTPTPPVQESANAPTGDQGGLLVYHQITDLAEESGTISSPVLSADGSRAAFGYGIDDSANGTYGWNRVYVVNADGTGLTKVDDYRREMCLCDPIVDVSADGGTVVSTDQLQIRIAGTGDAATLVALPDRRITALRIAGDGRTVVFVVDRDTSIAETGEELPRGVWAIDADGGNLRRVAGAEDVAAALGLPIEATWSVDDECCFPAGGRYGLDVSDDGQTVAFGAFAAGERVFVADVGGAPRPLLGPVFFVNRVAISGDGATVAYDVFRTEADLLEDNEIAVVGTGGADPRVLTTGTASTGQPLQLSRDGSRLLVSRDSLLIDTATGAMRQLAVKTPGTDPATAVLTDGLDLATMNADATRFLYVIHPHGCDACQPNQLATLDLDPDDIGAAPLIAEPTIDPATILRDGGSLATAHAVVEAAGTLQGVGLVALRDGREDTSIGDDGGYGAVLHDDGSDGDVDAADGVFTADEIRHYGSLSEEADDTGPRTVRIQAEVVADDGLRHATAVEFGPLTVAAAGPIGGSATASEECIAVGAWYVELETRLARLYPAIEAVFGTDSPDPAAVRELAALLEAATDEQAETAVPAAARPANTAFVNFFRALAAALTELADAAEAGSAATIDEALSSDEIGSLMTESEHQLNKVLTACDL